MGVCVEGLIRNDFYDIDNREAVEDELNRGSQILNDYFHLKGEDKYQPYGLDCRDYQVYSERHHMFRMFLRKGYWHVSPAYKYHQLFTLPLFIRQGFYDVAKALGEDEAWYCDEFRLNNCGDDSWNYDTQSFEEWIVFVKTTYGVIREFPIKRIMSNVEIWPKVDPVYHDGFNDFI